MISSTTRQRLEAVRIQRHLIMSGLVEKVLDHEWVGREVLNHDDELKGLLSKSGYSSESIWSIFLRRGPQKRFANLVSLTWIVTE